MTRCFIVQCSANHRDDYTVDCQVNQQTYRIRKRSRQSLYTGNHNIFMHRTIKNETGYERMVSQPVSFYLSSPEHSLPTPKVHNHPQKSITPSKSPFFRLKVQTAAQKSKTQLRANLPYSINPSAFRHQFLLNPFPHPRLR